jgi:hypothetical protein
MAVLLTIIATGIFVLILSVHLPKPTDEASLPGARPSSVVGNLIFVSFPIVTAYELIAHATSLYLHSAWFSYAEALTRPVAAFIPGISRTVRQLQAAGLPDRAEEVGHYLALMWMLSAIGAIAGLAWQWVTWSDDNYVWSAAAVRRRWERHSEARKCFLLVGSYLFFPLLMIAAPFIGGVQHAGRFSYDFADGPLGVFMGVWWNGGQGWLFFFMPAILALLLTNRLHEQSRVRRSRNPEPPH